MSKSLRISLAGFCATAVTFGPARLGFGLFLPQFQEEFGFATDVAGYIAGGAFFAFFLALLLTGALTARFGAKLPVVAGGLVAGLGMALVAVASSTPVLAAGVAVAAASAGFCWIPYNNASERWVPPPLKGRVLSVVSTGTTFGIIATGAVALGFSTYGATWRLAWWSFAATGLAISLLNAYALTGLGPEREPYGPARSALVTKAQLRRLLSIEAVPLYAAAVSFGFTDGAYLSYWIDFASRSGLGEASPGVGPLLIGAFGVAGVLGLFTGDLEKRSGLTPLLRAIFLCSAASLFLLAWAPGSWTAVVASAALQGFCLMTLSAILSFWSARLYPDLASTSFTVVLALFAIGNVLGPPLTGLAAGSLGLDKAFIGLALISLATALLMPRRLS